MPNTQQPYDYIAHYQRVVAQLRADAAGGKAPVDACARAANYLEARLREPSVVSAFAQLAETSIADQQLAERLKAENKMWLTTEPHAHGQNVKVELNAFVQPQDAARVLDLAGKVYDILFPGQLTDKKRDLRGQPRMEKFIATNEAAALFEGWQLNRQQGRG